MIHKITTFALLALAGATLGTASAMIVDLGNGDAIPVARADCKFKADGSCGKKNSACRIAPGTCEEDATATSGENGWNDNDGDTCGCQI